MLLILILLQILSSPLSEENAVGVRIQSTLNNKILANKAFAIVICDYRRQQLQFKSPKVSAIEPGKYICLL